MKKNVKDYYSLKQIAERLDLDYNVIYYFVRQKRVVERHQIGWSFYIEKDKLQDVKKAILPEDDLINIRSLVDKLKYSEYTIKKGIMDSNIRTFKHRISTYIKKSDVSTLDEHIKSTYYVR